MLPVTAARSLLTVQHMSPDLVRQEGGTTHGLVRGCMCVGGDAVEDVGEAFEDAGEAIGQAVEEVVDWVVERSRTSPKPSLPP